MDIKQFMCHRLLLAMMLNIQFHILYLFLYKHPRIQVIIECHSRHISYWLQHWYLLRKPGMKRFGCCVAYWAVR